MTHISCYIAETEEALYMLSGLLAELSRVIMPATELSIQLIESALPSFIYISMWRTLIAHTGET